MLYGALKGQQIKSKCPRTLPLVAERKERFADIAGTELVDSETPKRPDSTAARH
jgi:hypothetical protein